MLCSPSTQTWSLGGTRALGSVVKTNLTKPNLKTNVTNLMMLDKTKPYNKGNKNPMMLDVKETLCNQRT